MASANASMDLDDEINESHNLSREDMSENVLGALTSQREISPPINSVLDRDQPLAQGPIAGIVIESDDHESQRPHKHATTGSMKIQIPESANIPPINNLLASEQLLDQGASAGAGTSTPIQVPSKDAARRLPRELRNLATTNKPGYSEAGFESNVPRIPRKSLELANQILWRDLGIFDEKGEELVQLSEPFQPGNEGAVVSKYVILEDMIKGLVNDAFELVEFRCRNANHPEHTCNPGVFLHVPSHPFYYYYY